MGISVPPPLSNHNFPESIQNTIDSLCSPFSFHKPFFSLEDFPEDCSCKLFEEPFSLQELFSVIRGIKTPQGLIGLTIT